MALQKSELRCETPACIEAVKKYGEHYHSVYEREGQEDGCTHLCDRCGARRIGGAWQHKCQKCGKEVGAGELTGFFVPHRCAECDAKVVAKERAEGNICRRCNAVMSYCCC